MCGILILSTPTADSDPHRIERAMAALAHRGPDGQGVVVRRQGRLVMGHRRLALFGLGEDGHQPMVSDAGDTLVFNGCIYNHPELRAELEAKGHRFRGGSDTEVILAAWREWQEDAFHRFNGTWALALHDAASDRLIISRDRVGVKPLFVQSGPHGLVLASEIRAIVAAVGLRVEVDPALAFDFLALGLVDHEDRTVVSGIAQVPAGALWVQSADGAITRRSYHHWPKAGEHQPDAADRLRSLLSDATALRLRSDVPVAAQLSGGMDSGAVAWAIGQHAQTMSAPFLGFFAYGYQGHDKDLAFDERDAAFRTRNHVAPGLGFTHVCVDPTPSRSDLDAYLTAQEMPVSTPSPVAGLRLYRAMRQAGATVALTGDGSDELFAGYTRRYLPVLWRDCLRGGAWGTARQLWASPEMSASLALARAAWSLPTPLLSWMLRQRPHISALAPDFVASHYDRLRDLQARQTMPLEDLGPMDARGGLLGHVLRYADRNAMAVGMESRSPFLDYRVVELAFSLPMAQKVNARGGKLPLRDAMAAYLPSSVIQGPKNRGLGHAEQFLIGALDLSDLWQNPPAAANGFIALDRLQKALRDHPGDSKLWWPVCFLLWLKQVEQQWP